MTPKKKAIEFVGVSKCYRAEQPVLDGVSFSIWQGDFIFLFGPSGAGKTTILRLIFAAEQASRGGLTVNGMSFGRTDSALNARNIADLRRTIGVVYQDFKLLPSLSVLDNVAVVLVLRGIEKESARESAWALLRSLGLIARVDALPHMLSGGEQQRVALARALIAGPKILLADEPTGNLDNAYARKVFELLMEANAAGVTLVVATHQAPLVEELGMRTIVLESAKVVEDKPARLTLTFEDAVGV